MSERRRANLNAPATIDEANDRLIFVNTEIDTIQAHIDAGGPLKHDGSTFTDDEFAYWRGKALGAVSWYLRERSIVQAWIEAYQLDVRAEEARDLALEKERLKSERMRQQTEGARLKREAQIARQVLLKEREESARAWQESIITQYGVEKPPPEAILGWQAEYEKSKAETQRLIAEREAKSKKAAARRASHQEWLRLLEAEEPIDGLDTEGLLRHAVRALRSVYKRGALTEYERAVMNVLEQRELVRGTLEDPSR